MNTLSRRLSLLALAGGALTPLAGAQLISYEGFNYDPSLSLVNIGFGGTGWTGGWGLAPGQASWTTSMPGMTYSKGWLSLVNVPGKISAASAAGCQRTMNLVTPLGGVTQTVWVSFLAQQTAGNSSGNWLGVSLPCASGAGINSYLFLGKPYARINWGTDAGSIASHRQTTKPATSKAFIVARLDLRAGAALDDVHVWINPALTGVPTLAAADLKLLNYGNFDGITKVQTQIGGGNIQGNIDEIRVGRDFLSVAPHRPGMMNNGFYHEAMGHAELLPAPDGRGILAYHIGGTGNDGVRVTIDSHSGNGIAIDPGELPRGAEIAVTDSDRDGQIIDITSLRKQSDGGLLLQGDFRPRAAGQSVTSVRLTAYDPDGNIVADATSNGSLGELQLPSAMIQPCPGGGPLHWYQTIRTDPVSPARSRVVWVFGCGDDVLNSLNHWHVLAEPTYSGGTGQLPPNRDPHKKEVTGEGLSSFVVADATAILGGAAVGGLGDAEISQSCGDAQCTPDLQQLSIGNIGGTGNDGVRVVLPADVAALQYAVRTPDAFTVSPSGQIVIAKTGRTPSNERRTQRTILTSNGQGGAVMTLDLSEVGTTQIAYTLSSNGALVSSGQMSASAFSGTVNTPPAAGMIWNWIDNGWPYPYGCCWGHLDAEWENWNAFSIVTPGGGTATGNQLHIEFLNGGSNIATFDEVSVTGADVNGDIDLHSLSLTQAAPPCRADFNADGFVDFFDIDAYVQAFENGDPSGDFNADGFVDFFDIDAFNQAFEAGC